MNPITYQLPEHNMIAGETQNLTIILVAKNKKQVDADGMTARLAISDYINRGSEPFVVKMCDIVQPAGSDVSALYCKLDPIDTLTLRGKFHYQITVHDIDNTTAILLGVMNITSNHDQGAITI